MDKEKFIYFLENPSLIDQSEIEQLEDLAVKYPFFQLAHTLIAKYTYEKESLLAPQKIRRAAANLYDRQALRNFIFSEWEKNGNTPARTQTTSTDIAEKIETTIPKPTVVEVELEPEEKSFFDDLDPETTAAKKEEDSKTWTFETPSPVLTTPPAEEELNETHAMDLFSEGKPTEAIAVYKKLMKKYPGRKQYFQRQLAILTDDDSYLRDDDDAPIPTPSIVEPITSEPEIIITQPIAEPTTITWDLPKKEEELELPKKEKSIENIQANYETKLGLEETISEEKPEEKKYLNSFFDDIEDSYQPETKPQPTVFENDAILLFNQGKTQEAIEIYEKLIDQQPDKKDYYFGQIQVLKSFEKPTQTDEPASKVDSFFEKIESTEQYLPDDDVSEVNALMLYNQGNTEGAVEMYQKLILRHPDKKDYYTMQIDILKS